MILRSLFFCLLFPFLLVSKNILPSQRGLTDPSFSASDSILWGRVADSVQAALYSQYKSRDGKYFIQNNRGNRTFHYWWNAHAVDAFLDGYERTKDSTYLQRAKNLVQGIHDTNGGTYSIVFYDDMLWLGIATLRAYEASGDPFFMEVASYLWQDVLTGRNNHQGGGIAWRKDQLAYKNTPANAPAVILACRLYRHLGQASDLALAKEIFGWLQANLADPKTGLIWDGKNRQGDGKTDKDWMFTYNQGVYFGAAHELYLVTGERRYLDIAVQVAQAAITHDSISPNGIMRHEGQGDGGLFKGIMARYLALLAEETAVGEAQRKQFADFIVSNASQAYRHALARPAMLVGPDWRNAPPRRLDMSTQLSGIMLFEAVARLD